MYSRQEESLLRKQFWTGFGQYLAPVPSAEGKKINWINYKTGIRFINFKMDAVRGYAYVGIEISGTDATKREMYFNHFRNLWDESERENKGEWIWEQHFANNGKIISRIYSKLENVNIYRQPDWPQIISFLKSRIIFLDVFWTANREIFEMLD